LRHGVNGNSIKVDDKPGAILRVETTIVHPEQFKVCRPLLRDPAQPLRRQRLRRSMADLQQRAEVSRAANARYLDALASASERGPLSQEAAKVCRPVTVEGQHYRPLNPWGAADGALHEQISQGHYTIHGCRNRDLRAARYPGRPTAEVARRQAAAVTRRLRLLRAHGLIKQVSGTHRWLLTERGRRFVTAPLAAPNADVEQLTQLAA